MTQQESAGVTMSTERERVYITLDSGALVALRETIHRCGGKSVVTTMIAEFAALMGVRQVRQVDQPRQPYSPMTITFMVEFSPFDPTFPGLGTLESSIREVVNDLMTDDS